MDRRDAAAILAQAKWLKDQIKVAEDEAKRVLAQELDGGERTTARTSDGLELGRVSMVEGSKSMSIDNDTGFLMWVKQRYPHEIVETVRDSFVKVCAEKVKKTGYLPDANGEVCPHVSLSQGAPYPKVTSMVDDADAIMQHIAAQHRLSALLHPEQAVYQITNPVMAEPDSTMTFGPEPDDSPEQVVGALEDTEPDDDPEPFIEEGPPNWPESNTFETSDNIRRMR